MDPTGTLELCFIWGYYGLGFGYIGVILGCWKNGNYYLGFRVMLELCFIWGTMVWGLGFRDIMVYNNIE